LKGGDTGVYGNIRKNEKSKTKKGR
jgi:hypothetical protein